MSDPQTPLLDALCAYAAASPRRFHMPGHKGRAVFPPLPVPLESIDVTELSETGCLYEDAPPFSEANRLFAADWHAPQAFLLAGGSTLGILAMLAAAYAGSGCRRLLCDRGCHKSVFHAMALCRLEPHYLFCDRPGKPPFADTAAGFSADKLENRLIETGAHAVILTSPTYAGVRRDIAAAAEIAHRHGALLLVDEAHGAHFPFCPGCTGAVSCGADLAVCSLHKTLPALGGAALLTASSRIDGAEIRHMLSVFGSSSPSFLIAASADAARARMETAPARHDVTRCAAAAEDIRQTLLTRTRFRPLTAADTASGMIDPLRLTVHTASAGLTGTAAADLLAGRAVRCEMSDRETVVFILSPSDSPDDLAALKDALLAAAAEAPGEPLPPHPVERFVPEIACLPGDVWLTAAETIPTAASYGRIAAETIGRYPPGVPLAAPGERITDAIFAVLQADPAAFPQTLRVLKPRTPASGEPPAPFPIQSIL